VTGLALSQNKKVLDVANPGKEDIMSTLIIIINNVTFATKTEVGNVHGFVYDASKNDIVAADFKLGIGTNTPPLTEQKLTELQDKGFFLDYPVVPKLGETAYKLEFDNNGVVVKISPYLTPEQEEEHRKRCAELNRRRAVEAANKTPGLLDAMKASARKAEPLIDALFTIPQKGGNK
jgi:hypothetical protein